MAVVSAFRESSLSSSPSWLRKITWAAFILAFIISDPDRYQCSAYDPKTEKIIAQSLRSTPNRGKLFPGNGNSKRRLIPRKETCNFSRDCSYCYNISIRALITDFEFPKIPRNLGHRRVVTLIPPKRIDNNCSDHMVTLLTYSSNQTQFYSWKFNDSLEGAAFISITSAFPIIVPWAWKGRRHQKFGGISYGPRLNQTVRFQENVTFQGSSEILIPPKQHRNVSVKALWRTEETEIPFKAIIEFSTSPQRICTTCTNHGNGGDQDICFHVQSHADGVEEFLRKNNFRGKILVRTDQFIRGEISGHFSGSYAERVEVVVGTAKN